MPRFSGNVLITAHPLTSLRELFGGIGGTDWVAIDGREVPADTPLAEAGLRDGVTVGARGRGAAVRTAAPRSLALLVAAGPAAGSSCTVPAAGVIVGRDAPLPLGDGEVSERHLSLRVADNGSVVVADLGSTNGTVIAGRPVDGERPVPPGELIWVGRTALIAATAPDADAALALDGEGGVRYSRSPRLAEPPRARRIAIPDPPPEAERSPFPLLAVVAPALVGVLMAVLLKQPEYLAFVALSPIMAIGNALSERRRGRRGHRKRVADYERRRGQALDDLATARQEELDYRRHLHPDPATLLLIATAPSHRLWERQPDHDDFLALRVGTGTVPWAPGGPGRPAGHDDAADEELRDAPVVLDLPGCGAVGLTGRARDTRALARGMLLSLAALHSPGDVSVTVLTGPEAAADWDWIRWLPHARQPESSDGVVRVGNDPDSIQLRVAELNAVLEARRPVTAQGRPTPAPRSADVVVLDGSYRLRLGSDLGPLLREGPAAGIYFLCLDDTPARLPPECRQGVVQLADDRGGIVAQVHGPDGELAGVADAVSPPVGEAAARAMAPIREAGGYGVRGYAQDALPASLRFLDAAGLEPVSPQLIRAGWAQGGRTTRALLGAGADGPFVLDLAQGPHLLVAGTTGSGKSELLQTLVASLAAANRPDAMNFVLVDYKGGAAFRSCEPLPHTVGVLTDLDEFLVERALTSLRAELQRRKAILARADKADIHRYWDVLPARPGTDPLPRLVIVVDEFAVMAEQLPGQLKSLVEIGAQGRSLGVHLVLATQRPAGVVNADLRANMNLRIALRVASADDSRDVIETVDAARIPAENTAGRAYAWLGGGRPVAFQAARVGGPRPGARTARAQARVVTLEWAEMGHPLPRAPEAPPDSGESTDLSVLVAAIAAAARDDRLGRQSSPWRAPLPDLVTLGQLPRPAAGNSLQLVFGLTDRPREQRQVLAVLDVVSGGHLLVAGAPQSGRSTLLRTLAGCLAAQASPDDVHLYAIDCGSSLAALSALPHCGAVVTPADPDRVDRLLGRLTGELDRRRRLLSAEGYSDLAEYRAAHPAGASPPFLLVLVDRYDAFVTALEQVDGGRLVGQLQRLIRDGLAAGIRVVATGDRSLLSGRLSGLAEDKIVLRLADPADYALVGLNAKTVPAAMPGGRGLRLPGGDLLQVAVLSAEANGAAENRTLRDWAGRGRRPAAPPFRVDPLPAAITYEQACELPGYGDGVLIGVGGDELGQVRVDVPGLLVIGSPGSGRSTALAVQACSLPGASVVLITPRRSILASALDPARVLLHLTATDAGAAGALGAALAGAGPAAIVVDDAELLSDTPLGEELAARYRRIRDSHDRILAATTIDGATAFRGLIPELAKGKCGLVLEPASPTDAGPFGARLPLSALASGQRLRGALVQGSLVRPVQVPSLTVPAVEPTRSGW